LSWLLGLFLGSVALAGCGSARPRSPEPAARADSQAQTEFLDGPPRRVRSRTLDFPIELVLPGGGGWQIAEGPTWLVADHRSSSSQLALRTWRAERLVRRAECEAQARLARPTIPTVHEDTVVDRHALPAPEDFDTELVVGIEPSAHGIEGYALVMGATVGRCYAAIFTTNVSGKDAEREVALRLGLVVDRILSHIRVRSVDERAPRRRLVVTPKASLE